MPVPDNVCVQCRQGFNRGHFRVTKLKQDGTEEGTIRVCSLICLIQWCYAYAGRLGARGLQGVQNVFGKIAETIKKMRS